MGIIQPLGTGEAFLKGGFFGKEKSGKSRTAIELLIATVQHLKTPGPIVMFDSEGGSKYLAKWVKEKFGVEILGVRARSFQKLMETAREAEEMGAAGFLVDSITHPSIECKESYMRGVNEVRKAKGLSPRSDEFQDIKNVRAKWAAWPNWFLNAKMHVVVCGRVQFEWSWEIDEETGKKELIKTGAKMRAENEFGYEPSLLVEMERIQIMNERHEIVHRAMILADRFPDNDFTGKWCDDPTWEFFLPHIELLTGEASDIDMTSDTDHEINEEGNSAWHREKRDRAILCEEIQGELLRAWPGQTGEEKKKKVEALETAFQTRSWTKIENTNSDELRRGLDVVRDIVYEAMHPAEPESEPKPKKSPKKEKKK